MEHDNEKSFVFALCVVVLAPVEVSLASSRSGQLNGVYTETRDNAIYEGPEKDWVKTKTTDCFSVKRQKNGQALIDVVLVQANAHLCTFSGLVDVVGNTLIAIPEEAQPRESGPHCQLKIHIEPKQFVFEDKDQTCKPFYCGARASFDGVKITRKHRKNWHPDACNL